MAIFTGSGVALVTPFHEDESINYDKLDEMLDYHCTHGSAVRRAIRRPTRRVCRWAGC